MGGGEEGGSTLILVRPGGAAAAAAWGQSETGLDSCLWKNKARGIDASLGGRRAVVCLGGFWRVSFLLKTMGLVC